MAVVEEVGGSWFFAYHCGICYLYGGPGKKHPPNNRRGGGGASKNCKGKI